MVIRRIREHVAAHNWFAVGVDLAIVVAGVFLGTQVNNWNEDRLDRGLAASYRAEIIDNLRANQISIDDQIAYYRQVGDHAEAALAVLEDKGAVPGEQFVIDAYLASQIRQRRLTGTAYDEMLSAGAGRLVAGRQVRSRLSSYYAQLPAINELSMSTTPYRDRIRSAIPIDIQRRIRQRCGDILLTLADGVVGTILPDSCALGLDRAEVDRAATRIRSMPGLNLDLALRIADIDARISMFETIRGRADAVRRELEALQR